MTTEEEREAMRQSLGVLSAELTDPEVDEVIDMCLADATAWVVSRAEARSTVAIEAHGRRWVLLHRVGQTADAAGDSFIAVDVVGLEMPAPCFAIVVPRNAGR